MIGLKLKVDMKLRIEKVEEEPDNINNNNGCGEEDTLHKLNMHSPGALRSDPCFLVGQ